MKSSERARLSWRQRIQRHRRKQLLGDTTVGNGDVSLVRAIRAGITLIFTTSFCLKIGAVVFRRGFARALLFFEIPITLAAFIFLTESGRARFWEWLRTAFTEQAYRKKYPWLKT